MVVDSQQQNQGRLVVKCWGWVFIALSRRVSGVRCRRRGAVQLCMHLHNNRICWQQSSARTQQQCGQIKDDSTLQPAAGCRPAELWDWSDSWIFNKSALWHAACLTPQHRGPCRVITLLVSLRKHSTSVILRPACWERRVWGAAGFWVQSFWKCWRIRISKGWPVLPHPADLGVIACTYTQQWYSCHMCLTAARWGVQPVQVSRNNISRER